MLLPVEFLLYDAFMANAFLIVMGIEFVKMLMLHTYGAVIDVLLFAIARQMIISHEEPMQTLMSVRVAGSLPSRNISTPGSGGSPDRRPAHAV